MLTKKTANYLKIKDDLSCYCHVLWDTLYKIEVKLAPSNNFAQNPRKFPGIFPGNPRNSQESFKGKSGENVDSFSQEFLVTHSEEPGLVTHSEEILVTLFKEFLVTNTMEFLVTNYSEKPVKICSEKVFSTNSWEFPGN